MPGARLRRVAVLAACLLPGLAGRLPAQEPPPDGGGRICSAEEVRQATRPTSLSPLRVIAFPYRRVTGAMERGLIRVERDNLRERLLQWVQDLRNRGVEARFGGMGEGSGFGGGGSYTIRTGPAHSLRFLGLATFKAYHEFDLGWTLSLPRNRLFLESSYQWRPEENFYGLGHGSLKEKHSNFALRQSWAGLRWEIQPVKRLTWGAVYKLAWMTALPGQNPAYSPPQVFFGNLPGYRTQTSLQSGGLYVDADLLRGEYAWGGAAHFGASYQQGLGNRNLRYFAYESQLEGRLPVVPGSSALVGQANFELNRQRGGSGPIPFYLLPHIGGSSTLRGFALDRFYGRNLALLSLEYRYRIHPNVQVSPFFDEGQIFDRTSDLSWMNWHRNYGIGFRFRSATSTFLRVEYGHSAEGSLIHITFGDRERPPLRGPVRYGLYKR